MSEPACRLGRGPWHHKHDKFGVSQAAKSTRFRLNDGVLRRMMRWLHVFMLFFHCLWVLKGRTDVCEPACRLGRGPWHHKHDKFGVSQAAKSPRFQLNDGVLQRKIRWLHVLMLFFHCLWVLKGRTDVCEPACRLGRGPWHHKQDKFGVSQVAKSPRFQLNDGVLRREMRWLHVFMLFFHCLWVWKGRTDVSELLSVGLVFSIDCVIRAVCSGVEIS